MKQILLDTNVLLFMVSAPERLGPQTQKLLQDSNTEIWFSAASIWEMAIKLKLGKLRLQKDLEHFMMELQKNYGLHELPVTSVHACVTAKLKDIHKDPFDRILIAQAQAEKAPLLSTDQMLKKYSSIIVLNGLA